VLCTVRRRLRRKRASSTWRSSRSLGDPGPMSPCQRFAAGWRMAMAFRATASRSGVFSRRTSSSLSASITTCSASCMTPPSIASFSLILKRWRRQLTATAENLRFKVQLSTSGIPAQAWNLSMVRQLLSPACSSVCPSAASSSKADLRSFTAEAWCVHLDLIPCERLLLIPEPEEDHSGPPLFLKPEEIIHSF
jgi:hypothetical protein